VNPVTIERAATQMGFPAPPLAMIDEVTLTLPMKIRDAARAAGGSAGAFDDHPGMAVAERLVTEFDRKGKAAGAGFYEYPADGPKYLWPGLWEHFVKDEVEPPLKCVEEGVLRSTADANIGSIFGIGFPPLHGGALQYINAYAGGLAGFAERARALASEYGDRFNPPALLVQKAEAGEKFD
jgi:3-hydroxyacyl-CoA dehydrogenase/enoyl-CoA hydratase/3-hydroxybutyryl-CoA epimerase